MLAPLGLSGWLGWRLAHEEENRAEDRARELMRSTLRSLDDEIHALLAAYETELGTALDEAASGRGVADREGLRRLSRSLPGVRQVFAVDPATGELLHPSLMDDLDAAEEDFLDRTRDLWTRGELRPDRDLGSALEEAGASIGPARGWYSWFWGDGLNLIFWRRGEGDLALGAELDRIRLLADVVALLPDTDPRAPALAGGRIRLLDTRGDALYEWGGYAPAADEQPAARQALAPPLSAWSLEYFADGASTGEKALARLLPALVAGGAAVLGLAFYFYRESSREMREAAQRVSFVNQVSHELKTPLTNIRMYAELLGEELDADDGPARAYVDVVISESQRLSRLILNILTFSRKDRGRLSLRPAKGVVDEAVESVLEHFRPAFDERRIAVSFEAGAAAPAVIDRDKVEQILGNLFANVEKYAASGKRVEVSSRQDGEEVVVTVSDRGPGIPARERERVFRPFYRISNALTDGVTGTGIGLAIARELARVHGGDLELVPSESGACFRLTLRCPGESA